MIEDTDHDRRIQTALLAIFLALLWWIIGVLAGSVAAFFVYLLSSNNADWPAAVVLLSIALLCGIGGSIKSFRLYRKKTG